jgi:hypothetical protein
MTRRIVCLGFMSDPTLHYAASTFSEISHQRPVVIDLRSSRDGFWAHHEEESPVCRIRTGQVDVTLHREEVSLFNRLLPVTESVRTGTRAWRGYRISQYFFERLLDEQFFEVVVNPWMAGWNNGTRPIHYRFLTSVGFHVPAWMVSNDPVAVRRFVARHDGDVFVKSVGHHRTISSRYSRTHARELTTLKNSPVLFQQAIDGPDVRVHVVGEQCFGVQISSKADDYRYPRHHRVKYAAAQVPETICALCVESTRRLGLVLSGIDFKICQATGEWYCLEANPMPGYSFYDQHLGGQISAALVELLQRGHPSAR